MKRSSTGLFDLIKSLSDHECAQFRKFAKRQSREKTTKYLRLFEAILAQPEYDEAALKSLFKEEYTDTHFANEKNRLFDLILRSLHEARSVESTHSLVKQQIEHIRILRSRNLIALGNILLDKVLARAERYELLTEIQQLLSLKRIALLSKGETNIQAELAGIIRRSQEVRALQDDYYFFRDVHDQIYALVRSKFSGNHAQPAEVLAALVEPIIVEGESRAKTFETKKFYYSIRAQYAVLNGNLEEALNYYRLQVSVWEQYPHQIQESPGGRIIQLANFAGFCLESCEFNEMEQALVKLSQTKARNLAGEAEKFQNLYHLRLLRSINLADFPERDSLVPAIEEGLVKYQDKLNPARVLSFYHNLAISYFLAESFSECDTWLARIIAHTKAEARVDIVSFAHLLQPIVKFETGRHDELESQIFRSRRFLIRIEALAEFDKFLLNTLRTLPGTLAGERIKAKFRSMLAAAYSLAADTAGTHILGLEEIICWLESRVNKIPIVAVFRAKLQKRCNPDKIVG